MCQGFSPEFEPQIHRFLHDDLHVLGEDELLAHFEAIGKEAERRAKAIRHRQDFAALIGSE